MKGRLKSGLNSGPLDRGQAGPGDQGITRTRAKGGSGTGRRPEAEGGRVWGDTRRWIFASCSGEAHPPRVLSHADQERARNRGSPEIRGSPGTGPTLWRCGAHASTRRESGISSGSEGVRTRLRVGWHVRGCKCAHVPAPGREKRGRPRKSQMPLPARLRWTCAHKYAYSGLGRTARAQTRSPEDGGASAPRRLGARAACFVLFAYSAEYYRFGRSPQTFPFESTVRFLKRISPPHMGMSFQQKRKLCT